MSFQSLTQQRCHLFPLVFFSNKCFCPQGKKKTCFPLLFTLLPSLLAFDGAHACWTWDFLVFQCLDAIEHQVMKDDLSLGDAQPGAPCPLLRHVRLEGLSLAFVLAVV